MSEQGLRKNKTVRHSSNIIFNLIALALLLTVIVFLHQILKKPKQTQEVEVKSIATLPAGEKQVQAKAEAQIQLPTPPPVQIPLEPEPNEWEKPEVEPQAVVELPTKDPVIQPFERKTATKPIKESRHAEEEISPAELDSGTARQKYLEENRRLSSGKAKIEKSPTHAAATLPPAASELDKEAARRFDAPSKYDLDDEAARRRYLEENKSLSRVVKTDAKPQPPPKRISDEYIPFEDR